MTLRDRLGWFDGEVNHRRWGLGWTSPGLSPAREVSDDHHRIVRIHRDRCR